SRSSSVRCSGSDRSRRVSDAYPKKLLANQPCSPLWEQGFLF
ncbi:MAG: hypothetical protein ACI92G_002040, partial [Candidatus Pelagisphaera sp.]